MTIFYTPQPKWHLRKQKLKAQKLKSSQWWKQKLKKGVCYYCQKRFTIDQLTMDHKLPLAKGGISSKLNVVVACQDCNRTKGTKTSVDIALEKINLQNRKQNIISHFMKSDEVKQHFLRHYPHATVQVIDVTGTNNHYKMIISCDELQNLPRITAHRSIMSIFDKQFKSGEIHALTIDLKKGDCNG